MDEKSVRPTRILSERKLELAISGVDFNFRFPLLSSEQLEIRIKSAKHNRGCAKEILISTQMAEHKMHPLIYSAAIAGWAGEVACYEEDIKAYEDALEAEPEDYTFL